MKQADMILVASGVCLVVLLAFPSWPVTLAFAALLTAYSFISKKIADETERSLELMKREIEEVRVKTAEVTLISSEAFKATQEAKKLISEHNIAMGFTQFRTRAQRQGQGG